MSRLYYAFSSSLLLLALSSFGFCHSFEISVVDVLPQPRVLISLPPSSYPVPNMCSETPPGRLACNLGIYPSDGYNGIVDRNGSHVDQRELVTACLHTAGNTTLGLVAACLRAKGVHSLTGRMTAPFGRHDQLCIGKGIDVGGVGRGRETPLRCTSPVRPTATCQWNGDSVISVRGSAASLDGSTAAVSVLLSCDAPSVGTLRLLTPGPVDLGNGASCDIDLGAGPGNPRPYDAASGDNPLSISCVFHVPEGASGRLSGSTVIVHAVD